MQDDTENWLIYTRFDKNVNHSASFEDTYKQYNIDRYLQPILYHYTKLKFLRLILCKRQFMMTKWNQMRNDPDEGLFLYKVYQKVCDSLRKQIPDSYYALLSTITIPDTFRAGFWVGNRIVVEDCIPYVACFSMSDYCSKMRINYGSNATLQLFASSFPYYSKAPLNDLFNIKTVKVRYGEAEVSKILENALRSLIDSKEPPHYCKEAMEELLSFMRLAVKKEDFAYEKEIRKILYLPINIEKYPELMSKLCNLYYEYDDEDCIVERKGPFGKNKNTVFVPFESGPNPTVIIADEVPMDYIQ